MARPVSNPPNRFERTHIEWDPESGPPDAQLEVFEERARSCLTENTSPDVPFRFGLNPYRGCQHACAYCYARRTHPYLGFGAGTDFEKRIVVKVNAPEVLARELARGRARHELVSLSGITDPYQPLEARYRLTRRCLEVLERFENPLTIITKSALVKRDVDVLTQIHARAGASVFVSIPFLDPEIGRALEPGVPSATERLQALRELSRAGIETGVSISPLIPGLNDRDIPRILEAARAAGARSAFLTLLRLPGEVREVFEERLEATLPGRAGKVRAALDEMRGGDIGQSAFGRRMHGQGARWEMLTRLFDTCCRRLGFEHGEAGEEERLRPVGLDRTHRRQRQGELFAENSAPRHDGVMP